MVKGREKKDENLIKVVAVGNNREDKYLRRIDKIHWLLDSVGCLHDSHSFNRFPCEQRYPTSMVQAATPTNCFLGLPCNYNIVFDWILVNGKSWEVYVCKGLCHSDIKDTHSLSLYLQIMMSEGINYSLIKLLDSVY